MKTKIINIIKIIFCVLIYCLLLKLFNINCPIKFLTGVSCAGCGMTRALISALCGKLKEAYAYHPLFWSVPIFVIIYLFKDKIPKNIYKTIVAIYIIMFLVCYGYRMMDPSDTIVVFDPKDSIIYKGVKNVLYKMW